MPQSASPDRPAKKPRVSKTDWLAMALDVLEEGGIEAVRVERLATRLGVAKAGFYYHFRNRDDLCDKLLEHWLSIDKGPIIQERAMAEVEPKERLLRVAEIIDQAKLSRYDLAIRQWARHAPDVKRVWQDEMARRIAFIRGMFEELGFEGEDLETRTRLFVAYQVSGNEIFEGGSEVERKRLRDARIAFLTARD